MMESLPAREQIDKLLDLASCPQVDLSGHFSQNLLHPIEDLLRRPSKGVRSSLVEIGYRLADQNLHPTSDGKLSEHADKNCQILGTVLEALHAGSLIVDDIQDNSLVRRGEPTLHRKYGMPVALNAGNWLYFWPMQLIESMDLPAETELALYRLCHRTLIRAHFGQALDVGVTIDQISQNEVHDLCLASLELKSGALMALAISLGATLAGASASRLADLSRFGHQLGIALQMFDDFGNLKSKPRSVKDYSKQREDLILRRPSWVWAVAARQMDAANYQEFVEAVRMLPKEAALNDFLSRSSLINWGRDAAKSYLDHAITELKQTCQGDAQALMTVMRIGERLTKAYE